MHAKTKRNFETFSAEDSIAAYKVAIIPLQILLCAHIICTLGDLNGQSRVM